MKKSHRISRRAIRSFLQLTAAAFAFSGELPAASAADRLSSATPRRAPASVSRKQLAPERDAQAYQHTFVVAGDDVDYPARVDVVAAGGQSAVHGIMHVPAMLGPLAEGAYTVSIRTRSGHEVQQVRIGPDTGAYLNFVAAPESADAA